MLTIFYLSPSLSLSLSYTQTHTHIHTHFWSCMCFLHQRWSPHTHIMSICLYSSDTAVITAAYVLLTVDWITWGHWHTYTFAQRLHRLYRLTAFWFKVESADRENLKENLNGLTVFSLAATLPWDKGVRVCVRQCSCLCVCVCVCERGWFGHSGFCAALHLRNTVISETLCSL